MSGRLLAFTITGLTVLLVVLGCVFPLPASYANPREATGVSYPNTSPMGAVRNVLDDLRRRDWMAAYNSLGNRNEFTELDLERDLTGTFASLRSYATVDGYDAQPLHISDDSGEVKATLRWATVVGSFNDVRVLKVVRTGNQWQVMWPLVREARVPPQVIPVNYLRWDVIYRGPEDDWGAQDAEAPHVRIIDMHPVDRGGGVVLMGEVLNEDVVPAFVMVKATLLNKSGNAIATEDAFDKISHVLLPKQVTPFRIDFRNVRLKDVDSVRMNPSSSLIGASADPVIEIQDQKLAGLPQPSLSGQLVNQSGQVVSIAHVLGTFYDNTGQLIWVADEYANRALLPGMPVGFTIPVPADLSREISKYRVVTSSYSASRL